MRVPEHWAWRQAREEAGGLDGAPYLEPRLEPGLEPGLEPALEPGAADLGSAAHVAPAWNATAPGDSEDSGRDERLAEVS